MIHDTSLLVHIHVGFSHFSFCISNFWPPGPGCSKLTTSLINETLKFQMLISQICQYFLLKNFEKLLQCKSFSHFSTKNFSVFGYKVAKT